MVSPSVIDAKEVKQRWSQSAMSSVLVSYAGGARASVFPPGFQRIPASLLSCSVVVRLLFSFFFKVFLLKISKIVLLLLRGFGRCFRETLQTSDWSELSASTSLMS